jgi:hypothetical protein
MNLIRTVAIASFFLVVLPVSAHAFDCVPGSYSGKTWSVTKPLNAHRATLSVSKRGDWCVMRFDCPACDAREIWELRDNKLKQVEIDVAGKEMQGYGATLEVRGGVEGYYIDCPGGSCDAGVDKRYFWRVKSKGNRIVYTVFGVAPDKQSNPKAKARKRHQYTFTKKR